MTEQHKNWFEKLVNDREDSAKTLEKPSMRGIKKSVVEKYSDQAHFIYELLQNANDSKATTSAFHLTLDGLYFRHNGKIAFSISNPDTEDEDKEKNLLGHINSITAIANSNKTESSIGKFGVGFKAVFQYSETPHIYDPNFQFKISRFIVPVKLESDLPNREKNETVFYFPFDKNDMPKERAYQDILGKLKKLIYPTLFLSNLEEVSWETDNETGKYIKKITTSEHREGITYKKLELYQQIGIEQTKESLFLFTSFIDNQNHAYSIGYFLDEKGKLIPKSLSAFCFFPTKQTTNLNFILHAPFLLTDSREGIKQFENHNTKMIELLAQLAADSLLILKDLKLVDDDIIRIIPYKYPADFFSPFYNSIKKKFEKEELLPAKGGIYAQRDNAYWAQDNPVINLFSDEQLADLIGNKNAKWVFRNFVRNQTGKDDLLKNYITNCSNSWYEMNHLLDRIGANFIEAQSDEWLYQFYEYLSKNNSYWDKVKTKPIFLNQNRKAVAAFENNKLRIFLPDNDGEGYHTLNTDLFKKTDSILVDEQLKEKSKKQETIEEKISLARQFYEKFGILEHTVADEIEEAIERFTKGQLKSELFFAKTFKYYKNECPQDKIDDFIGKIKYLSFVPYYDNNENRGASHGSNLLYPTEKLLEFYEQKPTTKFVDLNELQEKYGDDQKTLDGFLKKLGVIDKDPDLKDEVYKIVIPKFKENGSIPTIPGFKTLFQYFKECKYEEINKFIEDIKGLKFILHKSNNDTQIYRGVANTLYYPNPDLQKYFETKPETKFVDLESYYRSITDEKDKQILKEFLLKIGVSELPRIIEREITDREEKMRLKLESSTYGYNDRNTTTDKLIEGCSELIDNIDNENSILLWKYLGKLQRKVQYYQNDANTYFLNNELKGKHTYFRRTYYPQTFESTDLTRLKTTKWLVTQNGDFVAPNEITISDLAKDYERNRELESLLGFKPLVILTASERIAKKFDSEEDAELAKKLLELHKAKQNSISIDSNNGIERFTNGNSRNTESSFDNDTENTEQTKISKIDRTIKDLDGLQKAFTPKEKTTENKSTELKIKAAIDFDEEEELKKAVEIVKEQLEIKKNRIDLVERINGNKKYSYEWFKAYLELLTTYGEKQNTKPQKSISFQEIKPYKADNKFFLLCGASSYISSEIESAKAFEISLVFGKGKKENITVEGVSKKGQDLLIYCPGSLPNNILSSLSNVFKVDINFTPVTDLLDRLYKAFTNSNYMDDWEDIQEAMPSLNYIYGPPGTGKTTTLCNQISTIVTDNPKAKILVLTPTNKAADVVCKKLCDINLDISTVRLSRPTDPKLEEFEIYRNTINDKDMESIHVVASTIHRLPYFDIENEGLLFQYQWDYVIFDESSMIGLHYITFALMALLKSNANTHFIIAGDPKQIPPVIEINDNELENFDFQDENIYKMMRLESFKSDEQEIREIDTIKNLDTQYRSVPQIGKLFSELSYSGLLKHDRAVNRKESKPLPEKIKKLISSNVTFIDIPLNKDDSIFKVSKLFYSSYQIYCTILVAEIIKYFDTAVSDGNWTIGLIAPYKAQAILLNKLVTSYGISEKVKVYSDTVHGFQGDECDIVFFVCNPNNYSYTGHEKSLLSKEYIYNVAISRAKDYLVILHPYSEIPNNEFIHQIGVSHQNNFGNAKIINSKEIEKVLFNEENHIKDNTYFSGHDPVNVFGLSKMKYFIKSNDTAIDIQLRDLKEEKRDV